MLLARLFMQPYMIHGLTALKALKGVGDKCFSFVTDPFIPVTDPFIPLFGKDTKEP